ncbi:MAG TPA: type II secretion system protein [Phycisphaerae bacterium]|nr:type II secretion system protein [Phycisphaerae bacterium]HRY70852.1 type II secretion system protein [Phycisphaerae bacterium]HSA28559.1 type II secretion system protein [Phycisphaerae bacterium]
MAGPTTVRRGAFTLIEVLVVVAIIALLVAILVPSFNRAREGSHRVVCRSNVKQITTAMILHAMDDAKRGVYVYTSEGADDGLYYLYPKYLKEGRTAVCPSTRNVVSLSKPASKQKLAIGDLVRDSSGAWQTRLEYYLELTVHPDLSHAAWHRFDDGSGPNNGTRLTNRGGHSYEVFAWHSAGIFPNGLRYDETGRITLKTTKRPSVQFILVDSDQDPDDSGAGGVVLGTHVYNNWPDQATNNHGQAGGNIGFLDGHVDWVTQRGWVPVHLGSAHLAWPEQLARDTYFPNLAKQARPDRQSGYLWRLH